MTTETLHGMLERLPHLSEAHIAGLAHSDCLRCALQPIADQLQAVVEYCQAEVKKRPNGGGASGGMAYAYQDIAEQIQRILGTKNEYICGPCEEARHDNCDKANCFCNCHGRPEGRILGTAGGGGKGGRCSRTWEASGAWLRLMG